MENTMDIYKFVQGKGRLSIGQMAELNCISEKALRLYQDKGLLAPAEIEESSGFRYYTMDQSIVLDNILKLQHMGFSLKEIKAIREIDDPLLFSATLEKKLGSIEEQIVSLYASRNSLKNMLMTSVYPKDSIPFNRVLLEWLPARKFLVFDIAEYHAVLKKHHTPEKSLAWYYIQRVVKQEMCRRNIPLALFDNLGLFIKQESLEQRDLHICEACIPLSEDIADSFSDAITVPAGLHTTYYVPNLIKDGDVSTEYDAIFAMLNYIEENGYRIRGDYFGEGNVDKLISEENPITMKLCIPIEPVQSPSL